MRTIAVLAALLLMGACASAGEFDRATPETGIEAPTYWHGEIDGVECIFAQEDYNNGGLSCDWGPR